MPRKFIAVSGVVVCPVCDTRLETVAEQDKRVATMSHGATKCALSNTKYRVDRRTGDAEVIYEKPAEVRLPSHGIAS